MAGEIHRRVEDGGAEQHDDQREAGRVVAQERFGAAREAHGCRDFAEVVAQQRPLVNREMQRVHAVEQRASSDGDALVAARAPAAGRSRRTDRTQPATASTVGTAVMTTRMTKIRRRKGSAIFAANLGNRSGCDKSTRSPEAG